MRPGLLYVVPQVLLVNVFIFVGTEVRLKKHRNRETGLWLTLYYNTLILQPKQFKYHIYN